MKFSILEYFLRREFLLQSSRFWNRVRHITFLAPIGRSPWPRCAAKFSNVSSFGASLLRMGRAKFFTQIIMVFSQPQTSPWLWRFSFTILKRHGLRNHLLRLSALTIKELAIRSILRFSPISFSPWAFVVKTGRWINAFTRYKRICIHWQRFSSGIASCSRGVPQERVLSPFLFMLYLLDTVEVLELGVQILVFADDTVFYVEDPNEERACRKFQNILNPTHNWCLANELFIEPNKCQAINFSCCRDSGAPFKLMRVEIFWHTHVKILGICLSRSVCFTHHFNVY